MAPPRLIPLPADAESVARRFRVAASGEFEGLVARAGDVLVVRPAAEPEGVVVLEAWGFGRPRLGRQEGHTLTGDGGEACSPLRWRVVGEIVAVLRGAEAGSGGPADAEPGLRVVSDTTGRSPGERARRNHAWASPGQLSLFGGACAA